MFQSSRNSRLQLGFRDVPIQRVSSWNDVHWDPDDYLNPKVYGIMASWAICRSVGPLFCLPLEFR